MFECGTTVCPFSVGVFLKLQGSIAKSQPPQWSHKQETSEDGWTGMGRLRQDNGKTKMVPQLIRKCLSNACKENVRAGFRRNPKDLQCVICHDERGGTTVHTSTWKDKNRQFGQQP